MNTIFRKTVCSLRAALIGYTPMVTSYVLAEEAAKTLNEYGKEANAYGRELGTQAKDDGPTFDGMNITFLNFSLECDSNQKAPITSTIIHP